MTWLKKIGKTMVKISQTTGLLGPLVKPIIPNKDNNLVNIITDVEAIGNALQLQGAQKLHAATPLVATYFASVLEGKKVKDSTLFQLGCVKVINGVVDILNSLD